MKKTLRYLQASTVVILGLFAAQPASAQTESWTGGGANQNWSTTGNWPAGAVPTSLNGVVFTNNATAATAAGTVDNIVDGGFAGTIASLQFANTNTSGGAGFYHTTQIGAGQTLTVLGGLRAGYDVDTPNSQISAAFTGAGTLVVSNAAANLSVSQGDTGNGCIATINMTNLNTFNATLGGITVGVYNTPNPAVARQKGQLYLAKTNVINMLGFTSRGTGNQGQIEIGENLGNGSSLQVPMYLGIMNTINVNSITVGADKQGSGALLAFNPVFTNLAPVAVFRGTNGPSSRVATWKVGDNSNQSTTGSGCAGTVDFSGGSLDALVDTMLVGLGEGGASSGTGNGSGTFTFAGGTNNVNTLYLGYRPATGGSSAPPGIMNVNDTATLVVNNAICLSFFVNGAGGTYGSGTLNINGGTVLAATVTNGVLASANATANINMTGGTLGITSLLGSIGTAIAPLKTVTLSGATLQLPVSGIQTNVVVTTLNLNGTTNTINISSVPATVITYPTQIPLIAYTGGIGGGGFNMGVSNLPGTYQGYISNNTANLSIDLVLTSGPTNISTLEWKGAVGANWDTSSGDWFNGASSVAYFDGAAVLFDDTATGPTAVNLTAVRSPAGMTVSNNALPYAFSGAGVGGAGSLTKHGNGTLLFTNSGNSFAGGITINAGTVQFGNGGTSGNLPTTGNVLDNGNLVINRSGNVTLPNTISGSGTFTKNGSSVLTVLASNDFSGTAVVVNGTMVLNGVLSGTLTNAPGTTIGGSGTNAGLINAAGLIQPSAATATPTTFTSGGTTTLSPGATLAFDLNATDSTVGNGVNDLLAITGDLDVNNNTIALNISGVPQAGNTYTLINFTGNQNGSFNSAVTAGHLGATLNQGTSPVTVTLTGSGANLKWDSTASALWDAGTTSNWLNLATSAQDVFYAGDAVLLDDSVSGVVTNITIPAGVTVSPLVITNNSSTHNYAIAGPGQIGGNGTLVKLGSSTLALNGGNGGFSGTVSVQGGTLRVGNNNAFGGGSVLVGNGGTLDLNGAGLGGVPVTIAGPGVGSNGALVNSGADQIHALNIVKLAGNATIGGTGRWDLRVNGANNAQLTSADGNTYNLVKKGSNLVALVTCTIDQSIGDIDVQGGNFGLQLPGTSQNSGSWFGDTSHSVTVESGALFEVNTLGSAYPLYRTVALNDGSTFLSDAGDNALGGSVVLSGNATINVTGGTSPWLLVSGVISGPGNLILNGTLPLQMSSTNTYTGSTLINSGKLNLINNPAGGDGAIFSSSKIVIGASAGLDVSLRSDPTLNLAGGQTLQGNGYVNGALVVGAGATLSAGTNSSATGALTCSNNVTLLGNALMKLNPAGSASDVINVVNGSSLTLGGTLTVTNISGSSFAIGNSFHLFNAATYSGTFTSITPATPGAGLAWDTNNLTSGVLAVVSGVVPQPGITSISFSGSNLVINGTNSLAGEQYNVLTTTNLMLPLANWTVLPTNTFSAGTFSITNTVSPGAPQGYYLIRVP
ncbi:MAG: autotransporter-associated beta strand repeat-containing protein [Verrucomicrobiae bacterium]|nr:autotransporter-associated beta strand repeat-containing protein [Verrucomicrobiae bacterium]